MTSSCVLQECPQSLPLPLEKAMKWLTVEATVEPATTAADSPSPVLLLVKWNQQDFPGCSHVSNRLCLVVSWIFATVLAMNLFHLIASEEIHDKTTVESVQRWTLWISTFNIGKTLLFCSASNTAPNSSNLGKVTFFTGATLEHEHNKWLDFPWWLTDIR